MAGGLGPSRGMTGDVAGRVRKATKWHALRHHGQGQGRETDGR